MPAAIAVSWPYTIKEIDNNSLMYRLSGERFMSEGNTPNCGAPAAFDTLSTDQFLKLIGDRVKTQRMKIKMSRKRLSEQSGVSERYLAQLESGQGNISIALLRNVASAIDTKLEHLMSDQGGTTQTHTQR